MDKFSTYFGLKLSILIFGMIEQLSVTLQSINTTANDGFFAVEYVSKPFKGSVRIKSFCPF